MHFQVNVFLLGAVCRRDVLETTHTECVVFGKKMYDVEMIYKNLEKMTNKFFQV